MKDVLLVDDDNVCNFLSTKLLQRLGFVNDIHTAVNGEEAINLFNDYYKGSRHLPDIILLDLSMPVMDGFEFIEAFRRLKLPNKENVKIIIVTSSFDPEDMQRANALGISQYITKPLTERMLMEVLGTE
jgi:CheY-like chemotaxis protein